MTTPTISAPAETKPCGVCGQPFGRKPGRPPCEFAKQKYCSNPCNVAALAATRRAAGTPKSPAATHLDIRRPSGPDWRLRAACRGRDVNEFFPESDQHTEVRTAILAAKGRCLGCPVREECLQWALDTRSTYGVFGGMDAKERAQLRPRPTEHHQ